MPNYRVTYVKNEVISCVEAEDHILNNKSDLHYEHKNGQLIFALIKAETKRKAYSIAKKIVKEVAGTKRIKSPK